MLEETRLNKITILLAIEEEFNRTYGKPFDWKILLKNSHSVRNHLTQLGFLTSSMSDLQIFKNLIKDGLRNHEKYEMKMDAKTNNEQIYRNNQYKEISDYKTLILFLEKNSQGVEVCDELVNFTYKEAKNDIERGIKEKRIKRINFNTREDEYLIFPMTFQNQCEIRHENYKEATGYGLSFYLEICKEFNAETQVEVIAKQSKTNNSKESGGDPNYRLPKYLELKQQWLKKNLQKK